MIRALLPLLLLAGLPSGPAGAQQLSLGSIQADPSLPVEIASDTLAVDQATGAATFEGGVTIGQGDLRIAARTVEVRYDGDAGAVARLLASGGVTFATPTEAAEAQSADYDLQARTLTLAGDVLLTQGATAISADRLVVDLAAGTARVEGNVRTVLGGAPGGDRGAGQ